VIIGGRQAIGCGQGVGQGIGHAIGGSGQAGGEQYVGGETQPIFGRQQDLKQGFAGGATQVGSHGTAQLASHEMSRDFPHDEPQNGRVSQAAT